MSHLIEDNLVDVMTETGKGTLLRAMAVFTVIELSGSFLTGKTGRGTTALNFNTFCESKYMPAPYHKASKILYSIFRNGVAHSYLAQGGAILSGAPDAASLHMEYCDKGLFIYIHKFADDVTAALRALWADIQGDPAMEKRYLSIFEQIHKIGMEEYEKFILENNIPTKPIILQGDISIDVH